MLVKDYLNAKEAAARLSVSTRTVIRWAKRGHLAGAIQINPDAQTSPYMIPEKAIDLFLERRGKGVVEDSNG